MKELEDWLARIITQRSKHPRDNYMKDKILDLLIGKYNEESLDPHPTTGKKESFYDFVCRMEPYRKVTLR